MTWTFPITPRDFEFKVIKILFKGKQTLWRSFESFPYTHESHTHTLIHIHIWSIYDDWKTWVALLLDPIHSYVRTMKDLEYDGSCLECFYAQDSRTQPVHRTHSRPCRSEIPDPLQLYLRYGTSRYKTPLGLRKETFEVFLNAEVLGKVKTRTRRWFNQCLEEWQRQRKTQLSLHLE